ncbi:hydroxyisourate hydrolase [bacterium]|nr:hydroxyisourate hydrolase [bacterium]
MSATLSTHVLDQVSGRPAANLSVRLTHGAILLAEALTNADGRVPRLHDALEPGVYTLRFAVGEYWTTKDQPSFYPHVEITFTVTGGGHYHVPLLLSPYGYGTYRGS